jgi:hypothetical protein
MLIELTVSYVEFGGNAANGRYFYSYQPDVIQVSQKDEKMTFSLSQATEDRFQIISLLTTDANHQFEPAVLRSDQRAIQVVNKNTHSQLTLVSVLVKDLKTGEHVSCDPQVLNVPDE